MFKRIVFIFILCFLTSTQLPVLGYSNIEIFDINKSFVIKNIEPNLEILNEVQGYINNITNFYRKFRPIPEKGFMIKIYLEPPVKIENKVFTGVVDKVIIIFPETERPFLMLFDSNLHPFFYNFDRNTDNLLKLLKFDTCNIDS